MPPLPTRSRALRHGLAAALAIAVASAAAMTPAGAQQQRPRIELRLPDPASQAVEGPLVRLAGVLGHHDLRDLLEHGFPVRVHYRVELWTVAGWFDDLRGSTEWDVVMRYDPLRKSFAVARLVGNQVTPLGEFTTHADAAIAAERPYRAPLVAPKGKRSYYTAAIDVESVSLSDLDEVERWLRGELRPAVRGRRNPGTALGKGLRTLATRLLGSESIHLESRSVTFRP